MAINLKTEEGMEFSFDTVEELMDFKRQLDADEASKESEDEIEVPENESKLEVGDKVRIVSSEDGTGWPYHYHDVGSVGKVVSKQDFGRIEVEVGGETQYLLPRHYVKLSDKLDEAKTKFEEINGEDVEVVENEQEFKVGDKVRVVGNDYGHWMELGELREIKEVDLDEPKYNLSGSSCGYWASTSDIEPAHSSTKFGTGDVVKVTESFEDIFGDRVSCGAVYNYDENLLYGEPFVGTVFLGDNRDKIELVCRAEDRLDK